MGRLPLSFKRWVLGIFGAPTSPDPDLNIHFYTLNQMIWGIFVLFFYLSGKLYLLGLNSLVFGLLIMAVISVVILRRMLFQDKLEATISLNINLFWVIFSFAIWFSDRLFTPMLLGQIFIVILAGIFCSRRFAVNLSLFSILIDIFASIYYSRLERIVLFKFNALDEWLVIILFLLAAGILSDNTKNILFRKNEERSENARRYQAFFERATDAVFLLSKTGVVLYVNQHALDLLNYPMGELVGMHVDQLIAAEENLDMSAVKQ